MSSHLNRTPSFKSASSFVPGVYDYCDRWCERCPLSRRCLLFAIESPAEGSRLERHLWRAEAQDLLHLLEGPKSTQDRVGQSAGIQAPPESHPLLTGAADYAEAAQNWIQTHHRLLDSIFAVLQDTGREAPSESGFSAVTDALDTIVWNRVVIQVKLQHALQIGAWGGDCDPSGSAKVTLMAIEGSIRAWIKISDWVAADSVLDLVRRLDVLARSIETCFPRAWSFARPGFDEG